MRARIPPAVYPRAYGGTLCGYASADPARGLSPRLRGNQGQSVSLLPPSRSIPAPTGEPGRYGSARRIHGVYTRAHGGAPTRRVDRGSDGGLSPRPPGSPSHPLDDSGRPRSIPAPTGEPAQSRRYGGAHTSIPASTGEPLALRLWPHAAAGVRTALDASRRDDHLRWRKEAPAAALAKARRLRWLRRVLTLGIAVEVVAVGNRSPPAQTKPTEACPANYCDHSSMWYNAESKGSDWNANQKPSLTMVG